MEESSPTFVPFEPSDIVDQEPGAAVASILDRTLAMNASDLFLLANEGHYTVNVRRMGFIEHIVTIPWNRGLQIVNLIKSSADMDLAERRRPADGRWTYETEEGPVDFRVNAVNTLNGEDLALRVLCRPEGALKLDSLGLVGDQMHDVQAMLGSASGLLLVTGPTGCGKTTTLYSCLDYLNDGSRKINTIEDPIEYAFKGLRQSQVQPKLDLNFAELLRGIMRQSPDVIMIGEIRDEETASIAVRAANSGQLVLSTLHSPIAAAAVQSMLSLEVPAFYLANCLLGVISQRLIRTLSPRTRKPSDISSSPGTFAEVEQYLQPGEGRVIYDPDPEDPASQGGYVSQTGLFEIMLLNQKLRDAVAQSRPVSEVHQLALDNGMLDFRQAALIKVAQGVTSVTEISRAVPASNAELDSIYNESL